jgi:tetratricopeptide (TPR) repeat protein
MLSQAYLLAGLFKQALAVNDAGLEAIEEQAQQTCGVVLGLSINQLLGFDTVHWIRCLRARILFYLGQFEEADRWLLRVLQVDPEKIDPVVHFIPHAVGAELAWYRGDPVAAKRHAKEVGSYAAQSAMPYLRVVALLCQGLALSAGGDYPAAESQLQDALATARSSGAGMEFEAKLMAWLADTQGRAGEWQRAVAQAYQAIDAARRRSDRFAECYAHILAAQALLAHRGAARHREANGLLDRAERLLRETGAEMLRPLLQHAQGRVDRAEQSCS